MKQLKDFKIGDTVLDEFGIELTILSETYEDTFNSYIFCVYKVVRRDGYAYYIVKSFLPDLKIIDWFEDKVENISLTNTKTYSDIFNELKPGDVLYYTYDGGGKEGCCHLINESEYYSEDDDDKDKCYVFPSLFQKNNTNVPNYYEIVGNVFEKGAFEKEIEALSETYGKLKLGLEARLPTEQEANKCKCDFYTQILVNGCQCGGK